jgi:hypothetical protein
LSVFGRFFFAVISHSRPNTEASLNKRTLSYALWALIEQLVPGNNGDRGQTGEDNRLFADAVLWMASGCATWAFSDSHERLSWGFSRPRP